MRHVTPALYAYLMDTNDPGDPLANMNMREIRAAAMDENNPYHADAVKAMRGEMAANGPALAQGMKASHNPTSHMVHDLSRMGTVREQIDWQAKQSATLDDLGRGIAERQKISSRDAVILRRQNWVIVGVSICTLLVAIATLIVAL